MIKTSNKGIHDSRPELLGTCGAVAVEALGLPWCRWIIQRKDWEWFVGKGVVASELRRLADYDPNTKQMRTDIVVTRADGMSVRLHPHKHKLRNTKRSEAIPIDGKLANMLCEDELAHFLVERVASAARTSMPQRAACLDAATSGDDAASSAAAASTCVPQR